MKRRIYLFTLVLVWLGLSGRLIYTHYLASGSQANYISLESGLRDLPSESEWMNIYMDGRKLGYSVYTINNMGADGYSIQSSSSLDITFGGIQSDIHLESQSVMDTLFRLESFKFRMLSEQYQTQVEGVKDGTSMHLAFIQSGDTNRTSVTVPEQLYTYTAIQPMVASKGIQEGETIKVPAFDPMSNELADVSITHEGKEFQVVGEERLLLNKLKIEFKGIPSIMWLDESGITYKEETIMGMTMERTTPELAMSKIESGDVDLLNGFAVVPNFPITRATKLKRLLLEIDGLDAELLTALNSNRQKVVLQRPLQLELSRDATPLSEVDRTPYLKASEMIQSDHPRIRSTSQEILEGKENPMAQTRELTGWVFRHLEKQPVASISGAVDILDTGVGDCTEHTTLYTALSRAAGIPTKVHVGLVYLQGRFLFHAWPVVNIHGEWVDVDPSLDQFPADATHIALLEGDFENLSALIPVLGNIEIRVLEQEY